MKNSKIDNVLRQPRVKNSLFWRIALIFFLILLVFSGITLVIYTYYSELYFQETIQRLNSGIAKTIAKERPYFKADNVDQDAAHELFHDIMVINPSVEVYLLDNSGKILSYFAPDTIIKMNKLPLDPINNFIANYDGDFFTGPDPRNPGREKPFSASEVVQDGVKKGYIYVILNSENHESVVQMLKGSYVANQAARLIILTLIVGTLAGLFTILIISGSVKKIINVINKFKKGELKARINFKTKGELKIFARSFNDMADTIVENIKRIENIDKSRRELVAKISHDLRTPLASINGYAETIMLKSDNIDKNELLKYINTIKNNSEKLQKLVDELFELSKLEARQRTPAKEEFSLKELVQDNFQKNQLLAKTKSIKIEIDIDKDIPNVFADIGMIDRVIQNLIENAIKYTDEGGNIKVGLNDLNEKVEFSIKDTGRGIPVDELNYLLNLYDNPDSTRKVTGNQGLGLSIVKKILELHNSQVIANSSEKGTRLSFILDAAEKYETVEKD